MPDLLSQRAPRSLSREGRILLLAEAAAALMRSEAPGREAAMFVGSCLTAWLKTGGAFEKHARVGAKPGSHRTAKAVFHSLMAEERRNAARSLDSEKVNNEGTLS